MKIEPGRYRLYAIDPGWLDPRDRRIEIRAQLPGSVAFRDLLAGQPLTPGAAALELTVPAGSLRILEATVN